MRQRWWVVAVAFVTCMALTALPAGAQLPVTTPTVPTPTVPAPPVPTPTVPTPTVPTPPPLPKPPPLPAPPAVPTPKPVPVPKPPATPAPSVPVHVPSVTVPSVKTPSVSTPAGTVPSASTPSVRTPGTAANRSGGASGSGGSGSSGGSTSGASSGAPGSTATNPAGSTSGSATSPGGPTATGSGATGADGRAPRDGSSAKPQSRAARVQQRERNLRRTVLRFHGCLARVPRSERRVLSLRAGVGHLRPHTRTEVARITHLRRARVIALEHRGLSRLRALNRAGACQDAGAPTTTMTMTAAPGTGTPLPPASGSGQRSAVLAQHQSSAASRDSSAQGKPERAELSISRPSTSGPGGTSFDFALVLGPLAFLAFLLVITREVRRTG